jgi:GT2 family glycosyltransferase
MVDTSRYRELASRLEEERERLASVRADYERITRSRFHALRMLWFSLKQLLGIASPNDVYAVWSTGLSPSLAGLRKPARNGAGLEAAQCALIEAWNKRVAERAMAEPPLVSVVIPVYDHADVTVRCLRSIADSWFESLDVQFIVSDDGSNDRTASIVTQLHGVDYVRSSKNEGFVRACNRGAMLARGKYLCFLNNDTVVRDGWLDHLVSTAEHEPAIGVVGAKLVFPDGRLQEAGGIIWRDASGWNFGRGESADAPRYNFMRDVDYVSGAALLVRRELFERVGGFSEEFAPAYYEDADLCFSVRALGYRVVYQPRSVVVHYDGATAGDARGGGAKRFQEINRPKFREKWAAQLEHRLENHSANVALAARTGTPGRIILVIDSYVPLYDREAGSQRMLHVLKLLRVAGFNIIFLPDNYAAMQPYTAELQQMGIEVLHHVDGGLTQREALDSVLPIVDYVWISRPDLYEKYAPLVRRSAKLRVIYDTVDLLHVRKRREAELRGTGDEEWRRWHAIETRAATSADATVVVTPQERRIVEELGARSVYVVPTIHEVAGAGNRRFEDRSGLLFIGNYNHPPNVDAVQWLCQEVMPIVWAALPEVSVALVGANPTPKVQALRSKRVRVTGYVRDLEPYLRECRLFVAPLRFGAGMKGKIGHALQYALPVVTTPVGAEGMGLRNGENAIIADAQAQAFASAILSLYGDAEGWQRLSDAAAATLQPFTPQAVMPQLRALFAELDSLQPV